MSQSQLHHYTIAPDVLADWLEQQGDDRWWLVDGDRFFQGRVSMPCPSGTLAAALRKIQQPLVVIAEQPIPGISKESVSAKDFERFAYRTQGRTDVEFHMAWKGQSGTWWLVEDTETAQAALRAGAN